MLVLLALLWFEILLPVFAQGSATTKRSIHLPLVREVKRHSRAQKRDGGTAGIGVGDYLDITYNVLVQIGGVQTPLVLDTGSADLWVVSDACTGNCNSTVPLYHPSTFEAAGQQVQLFYGDSFTRTHAFGPIGKDTAGVAGLTIHDQYLAAITDTNTTIFETGSAGILGLAFPAVSLIWSQLIQAQLGSEPPSVVRRAYRDVDLHSPIFPNFDFLKLPSHPHAKRENSSFAPSSATIASFNTYGPLFSRLIGQHELASPMFATTLQRDTLDVGGNVGLLSIGELPAGIQSDSLTWVPVRAYTPQEGGLPPALEAPNEVYPLIWEIAIDDVFFDGKKLARSTLSSPNITLSALLDTGNSLIRGPQDVIAQIYHTLGGEEFDCRTAHNLSFQIGGKMFPVDSRDFIQGTYSSTVERCSAALAVTDPPGEDRFLYSWSLGDPFLKSALVAFYYGNITRPSQDPPRIGLLSTVPSDSEDLYEQAVSNIENGDGIFPATSDPAPSGTYHATATGVGGVPQATDVAPIIVPGGSSSGSLPCIRTSLPPFWVLSVITLLVSWVWFV